MPADDLYAPVAAKLRVERSVAKIAIHAAMYDQLSGAAGEALRDLQGAYPVAMGCSMRRMPPGWLVGRCAPSVGG